MTEFAKWNKEHKKQLRQMKNRKMLKKIFCVKTIKDRNEIKNN